MKKVTTNRINDQVIGHVFKTMDYDKFKLLDGNRSVKNTRVLRILESIEKVGFRMSPIIVNKRFEVIDGQGRLEALKTKELPVYYVIDEDAGIEECRMLNIGMTNWCLMDFIESYAASGNDEYKSLLSVAYEFTDLGINTVLIACGSSYTNALPDLVKSGRFKMKRTPIIASSWLDSFRITKSKLQPLGGTLILLFGAMLFAVEQCNADRNRVFEKVNDIATDTTAGIPSSMIGTCRLLEERYNNHLGKNSRIYFSAEWDKWIHSCNDKEN